MTPVGSLGGDEGDELGDALLATLARVLRYFTLEKRSVESPQLTFNGVHQIFRQKLGHFFIIAWVEGRQWQLVAQ